MQKYRHHQSVAAYQGSSGVLCKLMNSTIIFAMNQEVKIVLTSPFIRKLEISVNACISLIGWNGKNMILLQRTLSHIPDLIVMLFITS